MLSKLLKPLSQVRLVGLLVKKANCPLIVAVRRAGDLIPPSQYDRPTVTRLRLGTAIRVNWEVIPLLLTTAVAILIVFLYTGFCVKNKVDVVFKTHSRNNISRTMDLRCPTVHKVIIVNQRYLPWPEMQDVLDKMQSAEQQVDVVFATHTRACISRTMDLNNPSVHKLYTINQRYEPWPELQETYEKMLAAEKRALLREKVCDMYKNHGKNMGYYVPATDQYIDKLIQFETK